MPHPLGSGSVSAIAAATLPSGDVWVFDASGDLVSELCGPFASAKDAVFSRLGPNGRFFWISGQTVFEGTDGGSEGGVSAESVGATIQAVRCEPENWIKGFSWGSVVAETTIFGKSRKPFTLEPGRIWQLIRGPALTETR